MLNYIKKALEKYTYTPKTPQFSPHKCARPNYGSKIQYAQPPDSTAPIDKDGKRRVQSIAGTFLYNTQAIDLTMIVALDEIAAVQSAPTQQTLIKYDWQEHNVIYLCFRVIEIWMFEICG